MTDNRQGGSIAYVWIGYNDIDEEGNFVTTDGSDASYSKNCKCFYYITEQCFLRECFDRRV